MSPARLANSTAARTSSCDLVMEIMYVSMTSGPNFSIKSLIATNVAIVDAAAASTFSGFAASWASAW